MISPSLPYPLWVVDSIADLRLPEKKSVTIRLDADVLEWFKKQGKGYQARINKLLRSYMEIHAKLINSFGAYL